MVDVAITKSSTGYPDFPYNPAINYPEYPLKNQIAAGSANDIYEGVRNNFYLLGYDRANYDTPKWNPLKDFIKPRSKVFIKPNLVDHQHRYGGNIWSVITHPSVLRAVADYAAIALQGQGTIIIGDNPHVDANFRVLDGICHLSRLQKFYETSFGIKCKIVDCRYWHMPDLKYYGFQGGRKKLTGDPEGEIEVNIGQSSLLKNKPAILFRGTYNERTETILHHIFGNHRYIFSKSIFSADTYISIPKLKTHSKVGITLNIKGLIGTISNKNCLVHWRIGFPLFGGDEFPNPKKKRDYFKLYWQHFLFGIIPSKIYFYLRNILNLTKFGKWYNRLISIEAQNTKMLRGAFSKNDTTWRMTVDVYNGFIKDISGVRKREKHKSKFLSIVDGIIGGDVDGPHFPNEKFSNVIITGSDFLAVDLVSTRLMNLDISKIQYLNYLKNVEFKNGLSEINVISNDFNVINYFDNSDPFLNFMPPNNWSDLTLNK